jgi:hypothetical protein
MYASNPLGEDQSSKVFHETFVDTYLALYILTFLCTILLSQIQPIRLLKPLYRPFNMALIIG